MKVMKIIQLAAIALPLVCFASCNSDDDKDNNSQIKMPQVSCCGQSNPEWVTNKVKDLYWKEGTSSQLIHVSKIEIYAIQMENSEYINIRSKIAFEDESAYDETNTYYTCSGEEISPSSPIYTDLTNQKTTLLWKY